MGILGLTHDDRGSALQKLPVAIKVAIGEPPDPKNSKSHPRRLDHFVFKRRSLVGQDMVWEEDTDLTKLFGENPREVEVIFMDDVLDNVLKTQLAWWGASECKCSGELVQIGDHWQMQAVRKTERAPQGEPWPGPYKYSEGAKKGQPVEPCGDECPDLDAGRCKPSGTLYFCLAKFPVVGAIACIRTTSYRSIRNMSNALQQIQQITGGRLAGIRMVLHADPEKIGYEGTDGKKHSSVAHILSLRVEAPDMKQLVTHMTETAQLFQQTTKLLGSGKVIEYIPEDTPERERAAEMTEFHDPHALEVEPEEPQAPPPPTADEDALKIRVRDLCKELAHNKAQFLTLLGQFKGDLPKLIAQLEKELAAKKAPAAADDKDDWLPESLSPPAAAASVPTAAAPAQPAAAAKKPGQKGLSF